MIFADAETERVASLYLAKLGSGLDPDVAINAVLPWVDPTEEYDSDVDYDAIYEAAINSVKKNKIE